MTYEEWNELMAFPDDMKDNYEDYVAPPDEVLMGTHARLLGLTPMFSLAEAQIVMETLNRYLATPLSIYDVSDIINLDLLDRQFDIKILPRKQRYVISVINALERHLSQEQRQYFLPVVLTVLGIKPRAYAIEISKFRRAYSTHQSHSIVKMTAVNLYDDFVSRLLSARTYMALADK